MSPILLYAGCVLGAIGVCIALPRRGLSPQLLGALIGALALGLLLIGMGARAGAGGLPNFNFYLFAAIALGASLRVISHPRPIYAALYFILTILSSAGLYVLLSAEFMAFALVIVYAGAILITYLFVIMLATQMPTADRVEALAEYDRYSREPAVAVVVGFTLVAAMTTLMAHGTGSLVPATQSASAANINDLPRKVELALRSAGLMAADERIALEHQAERPIDLTPADGGPGRVVIAYGQTQTRIVTTDDPKWPEDLQTSNIEGVGFTLLRDHPGSIEIAGVILLMAMLGAVVLAQKKVELDEAAKLAAQQRSLAATLTAEGSPLMAPHASGGPFHREADTRGGGGRGGRGGLNGVEIKPGAGQGAGQAGHPGGGHG